MVEPAAVAVVEIRPEWDDQAADREVSRGVDRIESDQGGGGRFRTAGASLGTKMIAGFGAVWAGGAALNIAQDLVGDAQVISAGLALAEQSFGGAIDRVREFGDEVNESFGVSAQRMQALLGNTGDLLVGLGTTADEAATLSTESAQLAGILSLASGGALSLEDATERLNSAMVGETDSLKAMGIAISAADIDTRLLANGQSELTGEARRAAEAQAVLDIAYEQSAGKVASYETGMFDAMEQQNELSAALDTAKTKAGELLNKGWSVLVDFIVDKVMPAWRDLQPAVEQVMERIQEVTESVLEFVQELWDTFGDEIMVIVTFLTESLVDRITTAFSVVQGIFETVTALLRGEWGQAWEAFAGVVTEWVGYIWREIKRIFDLVVGLVDGLGGRIASAAVGIFDGIWDSFRGVINTLIRAWNNLGFTFPSFDGDWNGPLPGGGFSIGGWTLSVRGSGLDIPELANGGVIDAPTLALIGEDNRTTPEIVSPEGLLRRIVREESGGMLAGAPVVHVYVGNDQLEPHMVRVVDGRLGQVAQAVSAGRRTSA